MVGSLCRVFPDICFQEHNYLHKFDLEVVIDPNGRRSNEHTWLNIPRPSIRLKGEAYMLYDTRSKTPVLETEFGKAKVKRMLALTCA